MENLQLNLDKVYPFVPKHEIYAYEQEAKKHIQSLYDKTGKGNDFLGWVSLPDEINSALIADINKTAQNLKNISDVVVVVGIGGSYLGAKAVIDALNHSFYPMQKKRENPIVLFAGQNIGQDYHAELMETLAQYNFSVIVISKSGTTTEPAIAFRLLKANLESRYGKKEACTRIVAITDKSRGALKILADREGYKTFVIPDDVGGRYSVLTPVGLLPVAVAGFDIEALVKGAVEMKKQTSPHRQFHENPAALYAATRNALLKTDKNTELLVNYNPKLHFMAEWWKQLYGESEGKEHKGIFPASVDFTSDLHSMGQYIQEGRRNLFETVLSISRSDKDLNIPPDSEDLDKLNFLAGKSFDHVNLMAEMGTLLAHCDGGVPNIRIVLPKLNAFYLGQLIYFFEIGCALSGYMLGVNPFDQPGVEAYKANMFALLDKPGFEEEGKKLKARL